MKVIIAGDRYYCNYDKVIESIQAAEAIAGITISQVISGRCEFGTHTFTTKEGIKVYGADGLGEKWAEQNNIEVIPYPADWKGLGKKAGPIRNKQMSGVGEALIAFMAPTSKGTKGMVEIMQTKGKPVFVVYV